LPYVNFNREQYVCGIGCYQIDLSYTGDFIKQKLQKINPLMNFFTLYDDKSSKTLSKFLLKSKPSKKPDATLSADNFSKHEDQKNFFLIYNTVEPMDNDAQKVWLYKDTFMSAL